MDANAQPPPENRAPWLDEAERAPIRDSLAKDTDLAVIGGGVAGVSVAFHAAGRGLSVVLLERDRLASRASGRNDGQILLGLGEHLNRILGQWGTDRGLRLWRFLEENHARLAALIRDERLPCAFVQDGGLRLADSESEMRELSESAAILARERIEHRLLDRAGVRDALPLAEGYLGGLFLPGEAVFDPAAFVLALAGLAREHGLRVREESPVTAVSGDAGAFQLELGDSEELRCKVLVHATAALAPELDRSGLLARLVFPFRGQLLASFPLEDELLAAMPRWAMSSHFCSEYFRVHERSLSLGGMRWSVTGEENGIRDDRSVNPEIGKNLRAYLARHFPRIAACGVEREWTGIMAGTPDGLPLIGEIPGRPGEYLCLAFNGYGMSFAFLAGHCIAQMIEQGRASQPAAPMFLPRRFA